MWDGLDTATRIKSALAVLLAFAILAGGGIFVTVKIKEAWHDYRTQEDYIGEGESPVQVDIPKGATLTQISDILVEEDIVRSAKTFDQVAASEPRANQIQAGRYNLKTKLPARKALDMLLDTNNLVMAKVTLREGDRNSEIVAQLAKPQPDGLGIKTEDLNAALADPAKIGLPAYANGNPEGYLFPDTYQFPDGATAQQVLTRLVEQYTSTASSVRLEPRAKELGRQPGEIVTIASIVELESGKPDDNAKVARVIYNRLEKGMPLGMDSTIHYIVGTNGKVTTTDEERRIDDPYNTYLNKGLPPGPIGNPSKAALTAALSPASGDWLYFVTVNLDTGETKFAATMEEHEKNVDEFQKWCQSSGKGRC